MPKMIKSRSKTIIGFFKPEMVTTGTQYEEVDVLDRSMRSMRSVKSSGSLIEQMSRKHFEKQSLFKVSTSELKRRMNESESADEDSFTGSSPSETGSNEAKETSQTYKTSEKSKSKTVVSGVKGKVLPRQFYIYLETITEKNSHLANQVSLPPQIKITG